MAIKQKREDRKTAINGGETTINPIKDTPVVNRKQKT